MTRTGSRERDHENDPIQKHEDHASRARMASQRRSCGFVCSNHRLKSKRLIITGTNLQNWAECHARLGSKMKAYAAHRTNPTQTVLPHDESLGNESQKIESIWTYRSVADQKYTFTLRLTQQAFQSRPARYRPTRKKSTSNDMRLRNRSHLASASDAWRGEKQSQSRCISLASDAD